MIARPAADAPPPPEPAPANGYGAAHARLLATSHRRLTGRPLIAADGDGDAAGDDALGRRLYEAPFVLLSHGTGADPRFTYGNRTAQRLFACDWGALVATPSRLSAEPLARAERERLLAAVARAGFIDDYAGIRISRTGRRFRIARATVWMLVDDDGVVRGQAATFADWQPLA